MAQRDPEPHPHHVDAANAMLPKVPEITLLFWVIKVLTTGMGEALSDFLGNGNLVIAAVVLGLVFPGAMWWQLRQTRYVHGIYWLAVTMVAVFGTVAADGVHVLLPYAVETPLYGALVGWCFWRWRRAEGTLSIHSIVTPSRERWYWSTVLATFALGTAAGDLTAAQLGMGFLPSAVLFGAMILVPLALWATRRANAIAVFWAAYVLTRPIGASIADWLGKPARLTGVGYGDGTVSAVAGAAIVVLVAVAALTRRDVQSWAVLDPDEPPVAEPTAPVVVEPTAPVA